VNFGLNQFPKHRPERFKNTRFANALLLVVTPELNSVAIAIVK
jgi:hypothetical protein